MALKNLFDMVKADRYTADGREALIKAQEAETEDARQPKGIYHWKSGDYRKEGDKYVKIGPGTGGAGKTPQKQNPTRSYSFEVGSNGMPKPGTGKQVQTFKTKKEAEAALKKQNAAPANKTTIRQGPNTKTLNETPAEHVQKNLDAYKGYQPYDMEELVLKPSGYEKQTSARVPGGGQSITYTKNGAEDITLFFDKHGELENADIAAKSKSVDKEKLLDALSFDLVDTTADIEEEYNAVEHSDNSRLPEFVRQEIEREYVNKINGEKWSDAEKDIIAEEVTRRIKERQSKSRPSESKPAERDLKKELWSDIKKREGALHAKGKWRNLEDDPEYAQLMKQYREMDEDAAPRALTGDCKIRVRK